MQVGSQQLHLSPPLEGSWIGERRLDTRLPSGMKAIEPGKQVPVGAPGTRSGSEIEGLFDPVVS